MTTHSRRRPTKAGVTTDSRWVLRVALPVMATLSIVAPLAWLLQDSRVPSVYSVMNMGYLDYGVGAMPDEGGVGHGGHMQGSMSGHDSAPSRLVTDMVADPRRRADVRVDLVTRQQMLTVGGRSIAGFTVNGTSPGPEILARQGQLIEVHLRNESLADGVTLHWHGVDVPNAMDGVAGVTQDAVAVDGEFTYRFVANQAGTYWYHSHQVSNPQVAGGLLGSIVVFPKAGIAQRVDVSAVAHIYGGVRTINGKAEDLRVPAESGQKVRVRVTNTDNGPMKVWSSGPYRLLATDGTDVHQPSDVVGLSLTLKNHSGEVHPMHLHGHHEVVLARNGVVATGSPWWVDSLNVLPGETYDIAFVANNPGIWMDHCHNLKHAAQGMIAHLMYGRFDTPYRIAGQADNQPE
jgi:FtsP/CotA-like multicopper oxidase with cupredoxin domain